MPNPSELERVLCEVHPLGIILIHTNPYLPRWISRQNSNSADTRLREMGWQRIAPWWTDLTDKSPVLTLVRYVGEDSKES